MANMPSCYQELEAGLPFIHVITVSSTSELDAGVNQHIYTHAPQDKGSSADGGRAH
jgi:hypothetical protein